MKKLCVILLLLPTLTFGQETDSTGWLKRTAQNMFGEEAHPEKAKFLGYPTLAYSPETSLEVGIAAVMLFYAKGDYEKNRLSEIYSFSFITFQRQYGIWLEHDIYGDDDKWFFLGKIRQQRFPLFYYGIGPETLSESANLIDANYTLIKERILRNIYPNLFFGLEIDYQRLYNAAFNDDPVPAPLGEEGSSNLGLGLGLVYDSRRNVLNERDGAFLEVGWEYNNPNFLSDYQFSGLYIDGRYFIPMTHDKKQVLAFQGIGTFLQGDVPFNQLALLGGEQMMRGYYTGRFRDKNYMAVQAEYRFLPFPFSKRFGAAAFIGAGNVSPSLSEFQFDQTKLTGGRAYVSSSFRTRIYSFASMWPSPRKDRAFTFTPGRPFNTDVPFFCFDLPCFCGQDQVFFVIFLLSEMVDSGSHSSPGMTTSYKAD